LLVAASFLSWAVSGAEAVAVAAAVPAPPSPGTTVLADTRGCAVVKRLRLADRGLAAVLIDSRMTRSNPLMSSEVKFRFTSKKDSTHASTVCRYDGPKLCNNFCVTKEMSLFLAFIASSRFFISSMRRRIRLFWGDWFGLTTIGGTAATLFSWNRHCFFA